MKTIAAMAVMSLLLLFVWERVEIVRVGYHIERLKSKKIVLQREHDELRVKVSTLTSPERIARAAAEKLAMAPPHQGQVILVRVGPEVPADGGPATPKVRLAKNESVGRMP
ncbi:MAG: cell division protein FtsL [Nitrospirota bacterium]|jgi:cell division protein FtsL